MTSKQTPEQICEEIQRDLYPCMEAVAARWLWRKEYSRQRGGQMYFYDNLINSDKRLIREMVNQILDAPLGRAKE